MCYIIMINNNEDHGVGNDTDRMVMVMIITIKMTNEQTN